MGRIASLFRSSRGKHNRPLRPLLESLERRDLLATYTTPEDKPLIVSDPTLASIVIVSNPEHGAVSLTNVGGFVYSPKENYNGPDAFVYGLGGGGENSNGTTVGEKVTASITVTPVNDPPSGTDKTVTDIEDTWYTLQISDFGMTDPKDDPRNALRAVKISTVPEVGALVNGNVPVASNDIISSFDIATGQLRYLPKMDGNGAPYARFKFQVQDDGGTANGGSDLDQSPNTIAINVTPVNDAPRGTDQTRTIPQNGSYALQAADFGFTDPNDVPSNALRAVKIVTLPSKGRLEDNGVPVLAGQTIPISEFVGSNTAGSIEQGSRVRYIPAASDEGLGLFSFTFSVQDNGGTANGGVDLDQEPNKFTINVTPVNPPKVEARADNYNVPQDGTLTIGLPGVLGNDSGINGRPLTASLEPEKGPQHGTLELKSDGSFIYKPVAGYVGPDTFVYRATDVSPEANPLPPASSTATVTITVRSTAPYVVAANDAFFTIQNTALNIVAPGVLGNDKVYSADATNSAGTTTPLNIPLAAKLVTDAAHGTVHLAADGSFQYLPSRNYYGLDTFTYRALLKTATGETIAANPNSHDVATVTIYVKAPEAVNDFYTTPQDTKLEVALPGVLGNDHPAEGHKISALLVLGTSHGDLVLNADGSFSYKPASTYSGIDTFTYRAIDTTTPPSDSTPAEPTAVGDGQIIAAGGLATVTIYVKPALPAVYANKDVFETKVNVALDVAPPGVLKNDYVIVGDPATGSNGTITPTPNYPLAAILLSQPTNGTVELKSDGSLHYVPKADFIGADTFTYRAILNSTATTADANSPTHDLATVTINVRPINVPPTVIANNDVFETKVNSAVEVPLPGVLKNDYVIIAGTIDPATGITNGAVGTSPSYPLMAILMSQPANGTVELHSDGSLRYVPKENFVGVDTFTYRARLATTTNSDANSDSSNVATVTINVTPNIAAKNDEFHVNIDTVLVVGPPGVLANDRGIEGHRLTAKLVDDVSHGRLELSESGGFVYTPASGFIGLDSFTYYAVDASAATASDNTTAPLRSNLATVRIYVQPVVPPVYAFDDEFQMRSNTIFVVEKPGVLKNDTTVPPPIPLSPNGDVPNGDAANAVDPNTGEVRPIPISLPLTAKLLTDPHNGELTLNPDGSFKYTPKANFVGVDSFTYRASVAVSTVPGGVATMLLANDPTTPIFPCIIGGPCPTYPDDVATVTIYVKAPEPPPGPVAVNDYYFTAENTPLGIGMPGVLANDRPGPWLPATNDAAKIHFPLTAVLVEGPANGRLSLNPDGSFKYMPNEDFVGIDKFTYQDIQETPFPTLDGSTAADFAPVLSNIATVTIRVVPAVAHNDSYTTDRDKPLEVIKPGVLANDSGGSAAHPLTAKLLSGPLHGTLKLEADGSFRYEPTVGYVGADIFSYRAGDGQPTIDPATGVLTIGANGDANRPINAYDIGIVKIYVRPLVPTIEAHDDKYPALKNTTLTIDSPGVLANDYGPVNVPVFAAIVAKPFHGTLALSEKGGFTYTPEADFVGEDKFTYSANVVGTSAGTTNTTIQGGLATVTIYVMAPESPRTVILGKDQNTTDESGPQKITDFAAFVAVGSDGMPPVIAVTTDKPNLFAAPPTIDAAGQLAYAPAPNASGTATITVNIDDAATGDAGHTQTFTIRIDKPHELYNVAKPCDVNGDDEIAADDVVTLINYINAKGSMLTSEVPANAVKRLFYDVDKDNWIAAIDVLVIINHINAQNKQPATNPGGEQIESSLLALVAQDAADAATGKRKA